MIKFIGSSICQLKINYKQMKLKLLIQKVLNYA